MVMSSLVAYIVAIVVAYLVGSVPMGLVIVKIISGRDIREVGSGRTGGTNALRAAGLPAGILTAFADMGKGFAAVYLGRLLGQNDPWLEALAAVAAVAG